MRKLEWYVGKQCQDFIVTSIEGYFLNFQSNSVSYNPTKYRSQHKSKEQLNATHWPKAFISLHARGGKRLLVELH
eukprot:1993835-Amphidinium_carterae.1